MSASVQLGNLGGSLAPAGRTTHGSREPDQDFDAELGKLDARQGDREPANTSGKSAGHKIEGSGEDGDGRIGGNAALLARLFALGDKPARDEQAAGEALAFNVDDARTGKKDRQPRDHKVHDDKAHDAETVATALAVMTFANAPAVRSAGAGPASDGKKLSGEAAATRSGNVATHARPNGEAIAGNGKEAPARIVDAAEPGGSKPAAVHVDPEAAKDEAGGKPEQSALAKVKVIDVQTVPAPAASHAQLPSSTASALARAIHSGMASDASAAQAAAAAADKPTVPGAVRTLTIQLQPHTLGTVTAQLRLSGESLHVDLQVNNAEAHHRLKSDSDAIVKSLRALGYDVDRITIQAPPPTQQAASGNNASSSQGREQSFQQAAGNSGNGQGSGHAGGGGGHGQGGSHQAVERQEQHSSSRGIYI